MEWETDFSGSPPHTWRTLVFIAYTSHILGITSTYVENTNLNQWRLPKVWDHLHIRGEHPWLNLRHQSMFWSPPHTWRTPSGKPLNSVWLRITSTYVENTDGFTQISGGAGDHLHIRGEHNTGRSCFSRPPGSPPHTWRTHRFALCLIRSRGITSTYVENTTSHGQKMVWI